MFDQKSDGSHTITLHDVQRVGCPPFDKTSGLLTWSATRGVSLQFAFDGLSSLEGSAYFSVEHESIGGVGRLVSIDYSRPDWIAKTDDDTPVRIYGAVGTPTSTHSNHNGHFSWRSGFSGTAAITVVDIPAHRLLAFENNTCPFAYRMLFLGSVGNTYDHSEEVSFKCSNGTIHSCGRCSIFLSRSPDVTLHPANSLITVQPAAWIAFEESPATTETSWVGHAEREFISFLNGDSIAFPFCDSSTDKGIIRRTYFGQVRCRDREQSRHSEPWHAPLPMFGVERFEYGNDVLARLPLLYSNFKAYSRLLSFAGILHPVWTALNGVLDDQLALASLSVERLSTSWRESGESIMKSSKHRSHIWNNRPLLKGIRKKLLAVVQENFCDDLKMVLREHLTSSEFESVGQEELKELGDVLETRIQNITSAPNSFKLRQPFEEIGLVLTEDEKAALKMRNSAMHGTDQSQTNLTEREEAIRKFDHLRMLITKFVLRLCKYDGPLTDYASRPERGNFSVVWMPDVSKACGKRNECLP